jgi:hypothetical protein
MIHLEALGSQMVNGSDGRSARGELGEAKRDHLDCDTTDHRIAGRRYLGTF